MTCATIGLHMMLGLVVVGEPGNRSPKPDRCIECGQDLADICTDIQALKTAPRWRVRARAARRLREIDGMGHPDAVLALCLALANDPDEEVREDAAGTLRKVAPPIPFVHETIDRASRSDPDRIVRRESKRALDAHPRRCMADCLVCGPMPTGTVFRSPVVIPPGWEGWPKPGSPVPPEPIPASVPPSDLPPALPDEGPRLTPIDPPSP